ncbi:MAG: hypothetical protein QM535_09460 [Limnohabitans sp.]|nr:hypothetical protein [Limnohabitans sp.]
MKNITYKDYIKGIKAKYEVERMGIYSSYLSKPSPALLNDFCKILKQNDLSKKDQDIINLFYNSPNFDNDKFKPICNFFKGKTETPNQDILDIMAFLVDFNPRPLGDFLKKGNSFDINDDNKTIIEDGNSENDLKHKTPKTNTFNDLPIIIDKNHSEISNTLKRKRNIIITFILLIFTTSIFIYLAFIKHKPYLQWNGDQYVEVDDEENLKNSLIPKIPYNESLLDFKKIEPTDTTTYFEKDRKAKIWYGRDKNGNLDLFNGPGVGYHPESNKSLNPITKYIINKHINTPQE